eukprot:3899403-Prorocentrum_lima.AAC.1
MAPIHTPPRGLVQSASSVGHAGADGRARSSTPPQRTPPSPRERTSTRSPIRRTGNETGMGAGPAWGTRS